MIAIFEDEVLKEGVGGERFGEEGGRKKMGWGLGGQWIELRGIRKEQTWGRVTLLGCGMMEMEMEMEMVLN